ncbi:MAG: DNA polymerase III subunit delta [Lachnospiraceae bacterium]|nr:DNA polymerase III subunit delta [Lachnospiraceae bacterium]
MKQLNQDIKNNEFKKVYLLTGDEAFLLRSYKKRLKSAIIGDDDMNYSYWEGKDTDAGSVIDNAETLPFFSDRKLIIIENSGWCKTGGAEMAAYFDQPCDSTYFIFVEAETDKRNKLYKKISELGYVCEMNHPKADDMVNWAAGMLMQSGKKITRSDLEMFLGTTGNDMELVKNELDKLISYVGDKDFVSREDIEAVTTVTLTNKVYDMCRAITQKKYTEAMQYYEDLLALRESPMSILYKISRQFKQLLDVKDLIDSGNRQDAIMSRLHIPSFVAGRLIQQARGYDRHALMNNINRCLELEEAFKTGDMPERLAVELLICGA